MHETKKRAETHHGCIGNFTWIGLPDHRFQAQEMAKAETESSKAAGAGKELAICLEGNDIMRFWLERPDPAGAAKTYGWKGPC